MAVGRDSFADDLRVFGAPQALIDDARKEDAMCLLPSNLEAFKLFTASFTQWRVSFAGATGLDYAGVEALARALKISLTPALIARVRILEDEALDILREQNE